MSRWKSSVVGSARDVILFWICVWLDFEMFAVSVCVCVCVCVCVRIHRQPVTTQHDKN